MTTLLFRPARGSVSERLESLALAGRGAGRPRRASRWSRSLRPSRRRRAYFRRVHERSGRATRSRRGAKATRGYVATRTATSSLRDQGEGGLRLRPIDRARKLRLREQDQPAPHRRVLGLDRALLGAQRAEDRVRSPPRRARRGRRRSVRAAGTTSRDQRRTRIICWSVTRVCRSRSRARRQRRPEDDLRGDRALARRRRQAFDTDGPGLVDIDANRDIAGDD